LNNAIYAPEGIGLADAAAAPSANPRVLLVHTLDWPNVARLALSFRVNACRVYVLCRDRHPARRLSSLDGSFAHRPFAPLRSLRAAIEAATPDLVIPCDDPAVALILQLHHTLRQGPTPDQAIRALVETSLGNPEGYRLASRRSELAAIAASAGVPLPPTSRVSNPEELHEWLVQKGFPAFLKADHSWGGAGVSAIETMGEADNAYYRMAGQRNLTRAIKALILAREPDKLLRLARGERPVLSVQTNVAGSPANCAVACWRGEIIASIAVEAVVTETPTGPATVIRVIDNAEMLAIASSIVRQLRVSGFFGFDFILDLWGQPHLIEINPRSTQINHLALGAGRDLTAALRARLCGEPVREAPAVTDRDTIALFPQEWRRDPQSPFLATAYHDVPLEAPDLVRALLCS
jgi:hypothetical protein